MENKSQSREILSILERLNENAMRAISLRAMERSTTEKETWEGILSACKADRRLTEPYNAIQRALMSELNITLVRMYDPLDKRNASFERLLVLLHDSETSLQDEHFQALQRAKKMFERLKGDHRLQRLANRRHRLLAHTALKDSSQQEARFRDIRSFVDDTLNLLNDLNFAVEGKKEHYDMSIRSWEQLAQLFWQQFGRKEEAPTRA